MIQKLLFSLLVEKMDDNYIYFELNNRKLKINKNDSEDIWIWRDKFKKKKYWGTLALNSDKVGYYVCSINAKKFKHHRVVYFAHNQNWDILDSSQLNMIDHIDQTKNNNHISNLRVATKQQNNWNMKNVKGYYWNKSCKRFQAFIHLNHKCIYLGLYQKEEDARNAYLEAKKIYHKW